PGDPDYRYLLSSYVDPSDPPGVVRTRNHMEEEWESSSNMVTSRGDEGGSDRTWGIFPQFVWPSVGDRVWIEGQWVFDCGHGNPESNNPAFVNFETEIHPPRAVVTFRLDHPGGNNPTVSNPYHFGVPELPIAGLAGMPLTEADVFVSG